MVLPPEEIARVAAEGRKRRRPTRKDRRRAELAPVVDVGNLSDADVQTLHTAYTDAQRPVDPEDPPA